MATEPAATEPAETEPAETPAGQTPPDTATELPGSTPGDNSNTIFLLFVIGAIAAVLLTAGVLGSRHRATATADKEPPR